MSGQQPEGLLHRVVEAILLAAEEPLTPAELHRRVCAAAQLPEGTVPAEELPKLVEQLNAELHATGRPYRVVHSAGGYALAATSQAAEWIRRAYAGRTRRRLSQAALEVLAIVAYRQPITRAEIDAIRGVGSAEVVQSLVERGLLTVVGRAAAPGRPPLYGTTAQFLALFGLNSLAELPPLEELPDSVPSTLFEPVHEEVFEERIQQLHCGDETPRDKPAETR